MPNSNDNEYTWTVADLRELDHKLTTMQDDIRDIKDELAVKNHIVVDNTVKTDWKAIAAIVAAALATVGSIVVAVIGSK